MQSDAPKSMELQGWRRWLLRAVVRCLVTLFLRLGYRIRAVGIEHIPLEGPAVVASNHISWLDGFFLMLECPRPLRMLVYDGNFTNSWLRTIALAYDAILIGENPKSIMRGLQQARQALQDGELVGIFPEGGISRSGQLHGFRAGFTKILKGTDAPVVPIYLDRLWGSLFSFYGGRFFWKWPRHWRYPVTMVVGAPMPKTSTAFEVRQAVQHLGSQAVLLRPAWNVLRQALRSLKRRAFRLVQADSLGTELTGAATLARALVLRRVLRRRFVSADETRVGVLLPPSCAGVIANLALALDRRIAVNMNYTLSRDALQHCIDVASLSNIVTSRTVMERFPYDVQVHWVPLEDLRGEVTWIDKLVAGCQAWLVPAWCLERMLGLAQIDLQQEMTTIFTSGSTGMPKGVVLTYENIGTNVQAIDEVIQLRSTDVIIGFLPFFHALGYTVTLWTVMSLKIKGVYHFSPLEAKQIGKLARRYAATILLATPTFLRSLVQRCDKEDFAALNTVVTGAEKLPAALTEKFAEKFDVRPVEGYGTTELSPLVSVNIPPSRHHVDIQVLAREGSVGRCVPGVSAKITDLETDCELGCGEQGMLWIYGPNVMQGYLHDREATERVLVDRWYKTGDLAYIDDEGFLFITGRESRFSKIGGEMVPHGTVEDALLRIVGQDPDAPPRVAVTAIADARKGERLVVVHQPLELSPSEVIERLRQAGLPNLWVPVATDFVPVDQIPLLGTGKADLKAIRQIAQDGLGDPG